MDMQARCSCLVAFLLLAVRWPATAQQSTCAPVSSNPLVMEALCSNTPRVATAPEMSKAAVGSLTLTVEEINLARLHETLAIRSGDALVFEANRTDFVLEIYLSSGREIVTQPGFPAEAENTATVWRKGRAKLDYAQALTQHIVGMKVTALHQTGTPLLLKGIKIDRLANTFSSWKKLIQDRKKRQKFLPLIRKILG